MVTSRPVHVCNCFYVLAHIQMHVYASKTLRTCTYLTLSLYAGWGTVPMAFSNWNHWSPSHSISCPSATNFSYIDITIRISQTWDIYGKPIVAIFNNFIYIQFNIYIYVNYFLFVQFNIYIYMEYFLNPFYLICLYLFNLIAPYPFNLIRIYSFNSIRKNIYFISGTGSSHRIRKIWTWEQ